MSTFWENKNIKKQSSYFCITLTLAYLWVGTFILIQTGNYIWNSISVVGQLK